MSNLPTQYRALVMSEGKGKPGEVWHPTSVSTFPLPSPTKDQVLIKVHAACLNHREIWIRKGLYFNLVFPSILGSDCVGTVVGPSSSPLMGKRVLPYPAVNWQKDPKGPDVAGKPFGLFGGTKETEGLGMFAEYVCVDSSYCVEAPSYLSDEAAAAVPVASLTAWRALVTKAGIKPGDNVLITGIGGGVAMQALQFAVALGARVWVTSGSEEKLNKAKELGAEGGVIYKQEGWAERLKSMLPSSKQFVDVVIDGSGGNIVTESNKIMTDGGIVVGYGATTGKPVTITMNEILRNIEYKSATMGSLAEYKKMIEFMNKHHVEPVVCDVVNGLDQADEAFQILQKGEQCGKVVMKISGKGQPAQPSKRGSH